MTGRAWSASGSKPGSLTSPFARHVGAFLIASVGALVLYGIGSGVDQPLVWLVGGMAIGIACGVLGGGWMGLLFVVVGLWIGLWFGPNHIPESGTDALHALSAVLPAYLAAVTGAVVAYAVALVVLRRVRGSGLIQRPSR